MKRNGLLEDASQKNAYILYGYESEAIVGAYATNRDSVKV